LSDANPDDYDALMLPGGVLNPDKLRINKDAVEFVKHFLETGKPIAAICHGPQTLIETGLLEGRRMTSYPAIKTDLINAGVEWVDEEVVTDHGLVTSRSPKDLPAFNKKMLEEFAEGVHAVVK
jgi:protease I